MACATPRSPTASLPSPKQKGKSGSAVYVAAVPLKAAKGPSQTLMSAAYSLRVWDLQHFMVVIRPDPSHSQVTVFDFQPQDPENFSSILAALTQRPIPGYVDHQACTFSGKSFTSGDVDDDQNLLSVSMTATLDVNGDLLLVPDGKPVIGPVPGLSNVFLATGHEGSGLFMTLGTAEMVAEMILGKPRSVDHTPFNVQGRFC